MPAVRAIIPVLMLSLAACGGSGDSAKLADFPAEQQFGNDYTIGFGETLNLAQGVALEFTTLAEDSRCATGVQCVWQGNARIILTTLTPRGNGSVTLNTNSQFPTSALFDYYAVELRKLEPYPVVNPQTGSSAIPISSYEATVHVDRVVNP
jgi:hypothetical protein